MLICRKRRVFDQCILPSMTYDAETWALTKTKKHGKMYAKYYQDI